MSDQNRKTSQSYRELIAWQKGMLLAKRIYRLTARFPIEEKFGLISQMRSHAAGSIAELDTQLMLSIELNFCSTTDAAEADSLVQELRKILNALRRSV